MRRQYPLAGVALAFLIEAHVLADVLPEEALKSAQVIYKQDFRQPVAGLRGGRILGASDIPGSSSRTQGGALAALALDPTAEGTYFPASFRVSPSLPAFLSFEVKATCAGRLTVHLEPVEIPASLLARKPERDWANPTRRSDFRAVVSLEADQWTLVTLDLNRDFFEAVTREKSPYDLAGSRLKVVGFEVNQPAEMGLEIWIENLRILELGEPAMKRSLECRLGELQAKLKQLPPGSAIQRYWKQRIDQWAPRVSGFSSKGPTASAWREMESELELLQMASLKWQIQSGNGSQYVLGVENSLQRVSGRNPRYVFRGKVTGRLELEAARNEYESFQLVILPFVGGLSDVVVEASELTEINGTGRIRADDWSFCHQLEQQIQTSLRTPAAETGWTPDALLPVNGPFQVSDWETKSIWATLRIPAETSEGTYQGQISVRPSNGPTQFVQILLHVYGFQIPSPGRFRTQGHLALSTLSDWYRQQVTSELRRAFYRLLVEHRLTPTSEYDRILSPVQDDIEWIMQTGGNVILIGGYSGHELEPEAIEPIYQWLVQNNYISLASIYIGDEPEDFQGIRKKALTIRQHWPKLRIMVGGSKPRPELEGLVDIWDPITSGGSVYDFDPDSTRAAIARGEEVFWYTCIGPRPPFANVQNDDPLTAIRALWWQAWRYGVTGFEYWWFNWWESNLDLSKGEKPWPLSRTERWNSRSYTWANGDGLLVYPGPSGQPLSCNRLSVIRDSIEDWEVLFLLARTVEMAETEARQELGPILSEARKLLAVPPEITSDLTHWSQNPGQYLEARHRVYTTLETLRNALGRAEVDSFIADRVMAHQHWMQEKFDARVAKTRFQ